MIKRLVKMGDCCAYRIIGDQLCRGHCVGRDQKICIGPLFGYRVYEGEGRDRFANADRMQSDCTLLECGCMVIDAKPLAKACFVLFTLCRTPAQNKTGKGAQQMPAQIIGCWNRRRHRTFVLWGVRHCPIPWVVTRNIDQPHR